MIRNQLGVNVTKISTDRIPSNVSLAEGDSIGFECSLIPARQWFWEFGGKVQDIDGTL